MDKDSLKKLDSIINILGQKELISIEINGRCNENGEIDQWFLDNIDLRQDVNYQVSLVSLSTSAFFPNITNENNKFYYSEKDSTTIKSITLSEGAYEVKDINEYIQFYLGQNITISLISSSGKSRVNLAQGWKVYFNQTNSLRKLLGFSKSDIIEKTSFSDELVDIVPIQRIYLHCDIVKGSLYEGKQSDILFSFNNQYRWGTPLGFTINPLQEKLLARKYFNRIVFRFVDNNKNPITFLYSPVCISLQIRQV